MPHEHHPAMPQVTAVDDQFGTHRPPDCSGDPCAGNRIKRHRPRRTPADPRRSPVCVTHVVDGLGSIVRDDIDVEHEMPVW